MFIIQSAINNRSEIHINTGCKKYGFTNFTSLGKTADRVQYEYENIKQ